MSERSSRSRTAAWAAGLATAALLIGAAAPALAQSDSPAAPIPSKITKLAFLSPELVTDGGWNEQGYQGAVAAAARIGAELIKQDGNNYVDVPAALHSLGDDGAQLIIAHAGGFSTDASDFAATSGIPVITYDRPDLLKANLVYDIETDSQNGAYLAGVIAALQSKTGTLGIVTSADDTNWHKQAGGFVAGAKAAKSDIKINQLQVSATGYADAPGGKASTQQLIASGADIIFGMGDGASIGMLDAVETATAPAGADKVWFIDVIGDKSDPAMDPNGVVLSSVLWNFTPAFEDAITQLDAGTYGTNGYVLGFENGGISLLQTPHITADAWAAAQTAQAAIEAGTIKVPVAHSQADVDAIYAAK